jgi:hypothetical protein
MTTQNPTVELHELYQHLLTLNQQAFALKEYNAAYHILRAALHCQETLPDVQGLRHIEQRAEEQLAWIDQHHPACELSTQAAKKRGHISIYALLARQAKTRLLILYPDAPRANSDK